MAEIKGGRPFTAAVGRTPHTGDDHHHYSRVVCPSTALSSRFPQARMYANGLTRRPFDISAPLYAVHLLARSAWLDMPTGCPTPYNGVRLIN